MFILDHLWFIIWTLLMIDFSGWSSKAFCSKMLCLAKPISPGSIWSETNYFIWKNISSEIITQGDGHWALHVLHFVRHNMDFYIKTAFKVYSKSIASVFTVKLSKTQSFCEGNFWQEAGPSYYLNFLKTLTNTSSSPPPNALCLVTTEMPTFGPKSHKTVQHILDFQS